MDHVTWAHILPSSHGDLDGLWLLVRPRSKWLAGRLRCLHVGTERLEIGRRAYSRLRLLHDPARLGDGRLRRQVDRTSRLMRLVVSVWAHIQLVHVGRVEVLAIGLSRRFGDARGRVVHLHLAVGAEVDGRGVSAVGGFLLHLRLNGLLAVGGRHYSDSIAATRRILLPSLVQRAVRSTQLRPGALVPSADVGSFVLDVEGRVSLWHEVVALVVWRVSRHVSSHITPSQLPVRRRAYRIDVKLGRVLGLVHATVVVEHASTELVGPGRIDGRELFEVA